LGFKRLLDNTIKQNNKALLVEMKKINELNSTNASKTPVGFYQNMIRAIKNDTEKFIMGYREEGGDSFFSSDEIEIVKNYLQFTNSREREAKLCEVMYPILSSKLLPLFPEHYELINSEKHEWIPQSCKDVSYNRTEWLRPDFFIAPKFLVEYATRENAVVDTKYGRLKAYQTYENVFILDGKSGDKLEHKEIGDFFYYFHQCTMFFQCAMRGLLFNEKQFAYVEFSHGYPIHFVYSDLTSPGTLMFIKKHVKPATLQLYECAILAFQQYKVFPTDHNLILGSSTLGVGRDGIVLQVNDESEQCLALKLIIDPKQFNDVEYIQAKKLMLNNDTKTAVVGVIENSLHYSEQPCYVSYLMPFVGETIPFRPYPNVEKKRNMIVTLSRIHAAGEIHGDPRHVNCVIHDKKFKWVDFAACIVFSEVSVSFDLNIFLDSVGESTIDQKKITTYAKNMVSGKWQDANFLLVRNEYLYNMIVEN
jgi:hypothetical protein